MDTALHTEKDTYHLNRNEALRYLGYRGQNYDESLSERIEELFCHCEDVSQPGWIYRIFPIRGIKGEHPAIEVCGTTLVLEGESITQHLQHAHHCALMAATCGLSNERELLRLTQASGFEGVVFDAAGSALVEAAGDACNAAIVATAREDGFYTNFRYGPGYGDLSLHIQPDIVRIIEADRRLGMTTTASHMLIPTKSITAIVGIFDKPQQTKPSCAECTMKPYCTLRSKGQTCYR